jgi:hypothetical protein
MYFYFTIYVFIVQPNEEYYLGVSCTYTSPPSDGTWYWTYAFDSSHPVRTRSTLGIVAYLAPTAYVLYGPMPNTTAYSYWWCMFVWG